MNKIITMWGIFLLLGLSFLFYAAVLRGVVGNNLTDSPLVIRPTMPFESSHERAPYVQMLALTNYHTSALPMKYANFASPDVGISHGKFFSYFPPAISFWILPFYTLGSTFEIGQISAFAAMILLSVGSLICLFFICRHIFHFSLATSFFSCAVFGFGSIFYSYAATIYQHAMTVFLLLFAIYASWKYTQKTTRSILWATLVWLSYGISLFVDYPNAFLFLPVIIYFFLASFNMVKENHAYAVYFRWTFILTSIVFILFIFLLGYYNQQTFGNWKTLSNLLPRYDIMAKQSHSSPYQLERDLSHVPDSQVLSETRVVNGLYELLFAPDKGLFIFTPVVSFGVLGMLKAFRSLRLFTAMLCAIVFLNIFFYASFSDPYGGWAFGPRYLIPAIAILSLFVGYWLEHVYYTLAWKLFAYLLFIYSSAISLLGALTTNLVPPQVEASHFHLPYGLAYSLSVLASQKTGSFMYHQDFSFISVTTYYLGILVCICFSVFIFLFLLPLFIKERKTLQLEGDGS